MTNPPGADRLEMRPTESLRGDPRNPKTHPDDQIAKIARSIRTVGFCAPLLVRGDQVVAGHGRLAAALLIGLPEVPVIPLEHLDDDGVAFLLAADNRLGELDFAPYDDEKLRELLGEIEAGALDLEVTGFSDEDLARLMEGTEEQTPKPSTPPASPSSRDRTTPGRASPVHGLKTWPAFFDALLDGSKTFELRRNDRGFAVGDRLQLREWDPNSGEFTGREVWRKVSYILDSTSAIASDALVEGFVVLGLSGVKNA